MKQFLPNLKKLDKKQNFIGEFLLMLQESLARLTPNKIKDLDLIERSNNLAQLFYNLARELKAVEFERTVFGLFNDIIHEICLDIKEQTSKKSFSKNIFRHKGWLLASFILNPKLRENNYLQVNFENIIYTETNFSRIETPNLMRYLSQLLQVSKESFHPERFKIILVLMGQINKSFPTNIEYFSKIKSDGALFHNICFDIINCFERVERYPELQKFICNLMKLSSETMNDNLIKGFILLHKHFEFSLYKKNTVERDSAINTIKSISIILDNHRCKVLDNDRCKLLVACLRFISSLDLDAGSTGKVLKQITREIEKYKQGLNTPQTIEINWSLMLLEQSGHTNITYLDLKKYCYDELDLSHKSMLYQFLMIREEAGYDKNIPDSGIDKSRTEERIIEKIEQILVKKGIEYSVINSDLYQGLQIDFLICYNGQKIACNIDGPFHFLSKLNHDCPSLRYKKTTILRNKMQEKLNLIVVCIDYRDGEKEIFEKVTKAISNVKPISKLASSESLRTQKGRGLRKRDRSQGLFSYNNKKRITEFDKGFIGFRV